MQKLSKLIDNTTKLGLILVTVANLWLAYQLRPLVQSIALLEQRVGANEIRLSTVEQGLLKMSDTISNVSSDTSYIRGLLENKK